MEILKRWRTITAASSAFLILTACYSEREHVRYQEAVVTEAPPPVRVETVPVAPGPGYVWVRGHWAWHNRWAWEPGHYELQPHARAVFVPGHWDRVRQGWVWIPGHWR